MLLCSPWGTAGSGEGAALPMGALAAQEAALGASAQIPFLLCALPESSSGPDSDRPREDGAALHGAPTVGIHRPPTTCWTLG